MSISHNKKRNTALLFEFLTQHMSRALVVDDERTVKTTLKLIEKYFKPESELFKEYRLARAIISTRGVHERIAHSILQESKVAVIDHDISELNETKRKLIRDINYKLGSDVFDHTISDFKIYATVHQLFELWRKNPSLVESRDLEKKSKLESVLLQWLVTEENSVNDEGVSILEYAPGMRRLIIKKMTNKINEKYSGKLTTEQRNLLKLYATDQNNEALVKKMKEICDAAYVSSLEWIKENSKNEYVCNRLNEVMDMMKTESYDSVDDDVVVRHMLYSNLFDEIMSEE